MGMVHASQILTACYLFVPLKIMFVFLKYDANQ